mgnify:CR=1 FL=1
MQQKLNAGIIFGGKSAEHEVSLQSAKSIIEAIDRSRFELTLIGIDKNGRWLLFQPEDYLVNENDPSNIKLSESGEPLSLVPGDPRQLLRKLANNEVLPPLDVVFPVLHGPYGEDGTMQGLLKMADLPFVAPGVLGSSVSMDKDVMKRLLTLAKIPNADFVLIEKHNRDKVQFAKVNSRLGMPVFIKPANMGSSVGVNKASNEDEFNRYLDFALQFDHKVVVEQFIKGREIECAVLGNEDPQASAPGEIIAHHDFYSYDAKYIDDKGATLKVPAELEDDTVKKVKAMAIKTFQVLCCEGMGRVDMFLTGQGEIFVNEINTIPGFTKISMYPKLWGYSGIPYTELISRLLDLAIARHQRESTLKISM